MFAGCKSQFEQNPYKYGYYSSRDGSPNNEDIICRLYMCAEETRLSSIYLFNSLCSCTIIFFVIRSADKTIEKSLIVSNFNNCGLPDM